MKFCVERKTLVNALNAIACVAKKNIIKPILSCVMFDCRAETVVLHGTDLESYLQIRLNIKPDSPGCSVVDLQRVMQIAKGSKDDNIILEGQNGSLKITAGGTFELLDIKAEDYPSAPDMPQSGGIVVNYEDFCSVAKIARIAVTSQKEYVKLDGIDIKFENGELSLSATDSKRRSMSSLKSESKEALECVMTKEGLNVVQNLMAIANNNDNQISLIVKDGLAVFNSGFFTYGTRLMQRGLIKFPDFEMGKIVFRANTSELISSLEQMTAVMSEDSNTIRFSFSKTRLLPLRIESKTVNVGQAVVDITGEYEGEDLEIGLWAEYLIDGLKVLKNPMVEIHFTNAGGPAIINQNGFYYLLMPIHL